MSEIANSKPIAERPQVQVLHRDAALPGIGFRWRICALIFVATTINYMDRQVIGILAPELGKIFGWNEAQYGYIVTAFQTAYAIGMLCAGSIVDKLGVRIGYAIAIAIWSLSAMAHSLAQSVLGFGIARFFLGLGESGNFPNAIKAMAEWFPQKERAFATGLFNSGANVGAIIVPALVPWISHHWGWRWAFVFTGVFSSMWLVMWWRTYRKPEEHPSLSKAELAYIQSDPIQPQLKVPWAVLVPHRQTWAFIIAKFLTDPIWWFFLFWLPKFLNSEHGISVSELGPPLITIYVMSDLGSIIGGWVPLQLIKRGWSVNRARKTAMLICALAVVPVASVTHIDSLWTCVFLIGLATAGHQGFSCNLFTLASDSFPSYAVASVVGIGGFGGAVGGMLIASFTGLLLQWTHSYVPIFLFACSAYLVALFVVQTLNPRLAPVELKVQGVLAGE